MTGDRRQSCYDYCDEPTHVVMHPAFEAFDEVGLETALQPALSWDPAIDRWVNEGGAVARLQPRRVLSGVS
jgi:hypothetical protein